MKKKKMSKSSLPLPNQFESCIGSYVSLITTYNIRYEGVIYHLDLYDSTLVLEDVICYGTEGRNKNGLSSPPVNEVRTFIHFSLPYIKEILVLPHRSYTARCVYDRRGATIRDKSTSNKTSHATKKPPLPLAPLAITQAVTDPAYSYYVKGLGSDISHTSVHQPRLVPPSNHVYMPCGALNQAPIATEFGSTNPPQSFFATFPPAPISLQNVCGFEFESVKKNMKQYDNWGGKEEPKLAYGIDGSFYMISRKPFEHIGRPYNPLGPIARPVKHN
ncbi:unnamed protein product [Cochlearia groenlandica]